MGPVSLVASCQHKLDFSSTASLAILGEKLGTDPQISQSSCCGFYRKPFLSGAMHLFNLLMTSQKVAICGPCEICMIESHTRTEREKRVPCCSDFPL
jgi:hypothetical protein